MWISKKYLINVNICIYINRYKVKDNNDLIKKSGKANIE